MAGLKLLWNFIFKIPLENLEVHKVVSAVIQWDKKQNYCRKIWYQNLHKTGKKVSINTLIIRGFHQSLILYRLGYPNQEQRFFYSHLFILQKKTSYTEMERYSDTAFVLTYINW